MARIGILGGTFNPVHVGHCRLAQGALEKIPLDLVLWIPAHLPPHKMVEPMASPQDRARMVMLAIEGNPAFRLSRIELDRPGPSYTIDTVRALASRPEYAGVEWFFLIGSDLGPELSSWRQIHELRSQVQFIVIPRPGSPQSLQDPDLRRIEVETPDVCASEIRKRVRQHLSIEGLVPEPVRRYIQEHRLYQ